VELNVENLRLLANYIGDVKRQVEHTIGQQPTPNDTLSRVAPQLATAEKRLKDLYDQITARHQADAEAIHAALKLIKEGADNPDFSQALGHTPINLNFADYSPLTFQAPQQDTIGLGTAMQAAVRAETQVVK